jgi:hypothetical protein
MIIEYRQNDPKLTNHSSRVLRTYKDVAYVRRDTGDTVHLIGQYISTDPDRNIPLAYRFTGEFFIACIHLAPGEYLECVDVPRD